MIALFDPRSPLAALSARPGTTSTTARTSALPPAIWITNAIDPDPRDTASYGGRVCQVGMVKRCPRPVAVDTASVAGHAWVVTSVSCIDALSVFYARVLPQDGLFGLSVSAV
jgi:hypothetical protein